MPSRMPMLSIVHCDVKHAGPWRSDELGVGAVLLVLDRCERTQRNIACRPLHSLSVRACAFSGKKRFFREPLRIAEREENQRTAARATVFGGLKIDLLKPQCQRKRQLDAIVCAPGTVDGCKGSRPRRSGIWWPESLGATRKPVIQFAPGWYETGLRP